jgi:RES domain-containing protein
MSLIRHRHPRFAELRDEFRDHPEWFTPWSGLLFRFQTVAYPQAKDILSGRGASGRGGRWNPPGYATVYGSTTDTTALEECKVNDR